MLHRPPLQRPGDRWTIDDTVQLRSPWRVTTTDNGHLLTWNGWTEADIRLLVPGPIQGAPLGYHLDRLMEAFRRPVSLRS